MLLVGYVHLSDVRLFVYDGCRLSRLYTLSVSFPCGFHSFEAFEHEPWCSSNETHLLPKSVLCSNAKRGRDLKNQMKESFFIYWELEDEVFLSSSTQWIVLVS